MSFHLADDMMNYLNANNVFHTNTDYDNSFDITPAGEVEGASLSRAFVLEPTKIDDKILSIYETIYIKISYTVDSERIEDYFKMKISPSPELEAYLIN